MTANEGFGVAFQFEGLLADVAGLDGSDHEAATQAARRLLALHSQVFLTGKVPRAALSEGDGYHVIHVASRQGSHVDLWQILVTNPNPWLVTVAGGLGFFLFEDEIKLAVKKAKRFLRNSVRTTLRSRPYQPPEIPLAQPVLQALSGNNAPIVDVEIEAAYERERLRDVTVHILSDLARPIGRSAHTLTIIVDGERIATIDGALKSRLVREREEASARQLRLDEEIADALRPLRATRASRNAA